MLYRNYEMPVDLSVLVDYIRDNWTNHRAEDNRICAIYVLMRLIPDKNEPLDEKIADLISDLIDDAPLSLLKHTKDAVNEINSFNWIGNPKKAIIERLFAKLTVRLQYNPIDPFPVAEILDTLEYITRKEGVNTNDS